MAKRIKVQVTNLFEDKEEYYKAELVDHTFTDNLQSVSSVSYNLTIQLLKGVVEQRIKALQNIDWTTPALMNNRS